MASLHARLLVCAVTVPLAFVVSSSGGERCARADVPRYDYGFGIGPSKRFLGDRANGAGDSGFGGMAMLNADVALAPLVRVGGYFGFELSPPPTGNVKEMFPFGARVTVTPPLESARFKLSLFAGLGYTVVYTHSYDTPLPVENSTGALVTTPGQLDGVSGSFFEIPLGARLSYNVRRGSRDGLDVFAELRGSIGFGFGATLYNFDDQGGRPGHTLTGKGIGTLTDNDGTDVFGMALLFGVQFDR